NLDEVATKSRTTLAALQRRKAELIDVRRLDASQPKLTDLYRKEDQQAYLEMEFARAKDVYVETAKRYDQVRLLIASRSPQMQILDQAMPINRRIAPTPVRTTVLALCLGLIVSSIGCLAANAIRSLRKPQAPPAPAQLSTL
ncbi:MAG: hypothetical protein ACM3NQ_25700, partial [Bacteroidales bacterium]